MVVELDFSGDGPIVQALEARLASLFGAASCACVNSGTVSLFLALRALTDEGAIRIGVHPFAPKMCYIPILASGNVPVFLDVDEKYNFMPSIASLEAAIEKQRIDGIMSVGMWDQAPYSKDILGILSQNSLFHIEDVSQSHMSKLDDLHVGMHGDVGCSSMHNNKILNSGEGGFSFGRNSNLIEKIRRMRQFGHGDDQSIPSQNYKLSGFAAERALAVLEVIEESLERLETKNHELEEVLIKKGVAENAEKTEVELKYESSCYGYYCLLGSTETQEEFHRGLSRQGVVIDTMRYGLGLATEKYEWLSDFAADCPVSDDISQRMLGIRIPRDDTAWDKLISAVSNL